MGLMSPPFAAEADRIRREYAHREHTLPPGFYAVTKPANLFADQQRTRRLLQLLRDERLLPLEGRAILDIGCGDGWQLVQFERWGARAEQLAGIDLIPSRVDRAAARFAGCAHHEAPQLQVGDASDLPWSADCFDVVHQSTVFSSILDVSMRQAVAREIVRVLKPGGILIWYDLFVDNPANPAVRGIGAHDIRALFPTCAVRLQRATLAPPLSRRCVPMTWLGSRRREQFGLLNTHYLGLIRKPL